MLLITWRLDSSIDEEAVIFGSAEAEISLWEPNVRRLRRAWRRGGWRESGNPFIDLNDFAIQLIAVNCLIKSGITDTWKRTSLGLNSLGLA
jgi:hypothetical protein